MFRQRKQLRNPEAADGWGVGEWRGVDGFGHVYFVGSNGVLNRYNVSAGSFTRADSGLIIEAGHTSTLGFDKDGNLWLGAQPVADLPNGGRVRLYLAADLPRLP